MSKIAPITINRIANKTNFPFNLISCESDLNEFLASKKPKTVKITKTEFLLKKDLVIYQLIVI